MFGAEDYKFAKEKKSVVLERSEFPSVARSSLIEGNGSSYSSGYQKNMETSSELLPVALHRG